MLVLAGSPWVVLYRKGYVRLCCEAYQLGSQSLAVHLTNQYQQKKNPLYKEVKEDTVRYIIITRPSWLLFVCALGVGLSQVSAMSE